MDRINKIDMVYFRNSKKQFGFHPVNLVNPVQGMK